MPPASNRMPTMQEILPPSSIAASLRPSPLSMPSLMTFRLPSWPIVARVRVLFSTRACDIRKRYETLPTQSGPKGAQPVCDLSVRMVPELVVDAVRPLELSEGERGCHEQV